MHRKSRKRNFGFGKQLGYAITKAMEDRYGKRGIKTQADHRARLRFFERFLLERGIRDLRNADVQIVISYVDHLNGLIGKEVIARKTAVNRLSSVNVLMHHVRGHTKLRVSPSRKLGRLTSVRRVPPLGMSKERVDVAAERLSKRGYADVGLAVRFCRYFGLRIREAALLDIKKALRQVRRRGVLNVERGTKGGRGKHVERWITVPQSGQLLLERALPIISSSNCLVPDQLTYYQWYQRAYFQFRRVARETGLSSKFHDLRASYAAERYAELTACSAPVFESDRRAEKSLDREARATIARELGHGRVHVTAAYLGGCG